MKKIISLCVAALAAITMTAQDIAVNIKLVAQSGGESTLLLASGLGVSSSDNATLVAPLTNTDNVAIFVQDGDRYSIYATDGSFANLPVSFITDRMSAAAQSYALHFEDALGGTGTGSLRLKDLVTGTEVTITDGATYGPFVVNTTNATNYVEGTNTVIGNRFVINYTRVPDTGDLALCFQYGILTIVNNPYLGNIVVRDEEGEVKADEESKNTPQDIDLRELPEGAYTVEFNEGAEVLHIRKF